MSSAAPMGAPAQTIWLITRERLAKLRPDTPIRYASVIEKLRSCTDGSSLLANVNKHQRPSRVTWLAAPMTYRSSHATAASVVLISVTLTNERKSSTRRANTTVIPAEHSINAALPVFHALKSDVTMAATDPMTSERAS